eukprot:SAG31_NODE_44222_length_263_cov_1.439024_1_plen_25_part_10
MYGTYRKPYLHVGTAVHVHVTAVQA